VVRSASCLFRVKLKKDVKNVLWPSDTIQGMSLVNVTDTTLCCRFIFKKDVTPRLVCLVSSRKTGGGSLTWVITAGSVISFLKSSF
jgi:hypothetical protein